eukprot:gene12461-15666_t
MVSPAISLNQHAPLCPHAAQGDLKDKWRNWQRNVANGWATARVYMPDDLKQRIEKLVSTLPQQQGSSGGRHIRGLGSQGSHGQLTLTHGEDPNMGHHVSMGMDHHHMQMMHQQHQQQQYEAAVAAIQSGMGIPGMGDGNGLDAAQLAAMAGGDPAMAEAMAQAHALAQQQQHGHQIMLEPGQHYHYDPSQM